ncbi:MAG: AAA family ATPase [Candidatus Moranbacteria bacterium]|nr:AAA family ATPase [Candidatus Moranbacteria bacterium]
MGINKRVVAIVGMAGAGKSEAINFLQKNYYLPKVYFGEITFEELERRGMRLNYDNERIVREDLRKKHGMGAYAELSLPKIEEYLKETDIVLVESLYSWEEYKILKKKYGDRFINIAINASPETRYQRLLKRDHRPMKDKKEFTERDWSEIENTRKGGPIAIADHTVINEGTKWELENQLRKIAGKEGF